MLSIEHKTRLVDPSIVLITASLLLLAAFYVQAEASSEQTLNVLNNKVVVQSPAHWAVERDGEDRVIIERPSVEDFAATLEIRKIHADKTVELSQLAKLATGGMAQHHAEACTGYRVLERETKKAFGGYPSEWVHYAVVCDPPDAEEGAMPTIITGIYAVARAGDTAYQISASDQAGWRDESAHSELARMLNGIRIQN